MEKRWWDVGGRALTIVYWGCVAIFVAAILHVRTLPFVDYPQHAALVTMLRRYMLGDEGARALYETNLVSYNSLFHLLAALLPLPVELAARVVVAGTLVLLASATLLLLRALGRPKVHAFIVLTVLGGYPLAWGFVNYLLGLGIALVVASRVLDIEKPAQTMRREGITVALALLGTYAHLFGTAFVDMLIAAALVARGHADEGPLHLRAWRAGRRALPLLPSCAYAFGVFLSQSSGPHKNFEYASSEGGDIGRALDKVEGFFGYATGLRADGRDAMLVLAALVFAVVLFLFRDDARRAPPEARAMLLAAAASFVLVPHTLWATNFVFERLALTVVVAATLAIPGATEKVEGVVAAGLMVAGVAAGVGFFTTLERVRAETADLDAVIDEAPPGRRLMPLFWDRNLTSVSPMLPALLHGGEWYVVRKGGECAASFARITSLPVHYRVDKTPPKLPPEFEWRPNEYYEEADFARYFDLILVRRNDDKDPRPELFGIDGLAVPVLSHHGRVWLLDAHAVESANPRPAGAE
jgi:hypothetical protein